MFSKLLCSMVVMAVGVAFVAADDLRVTITKVDGDKVTAYKNKTKTTDKGDEVTYTAKGLKVYEGTAAKKGKVEKGDEIKDGTKADVFKNIDAKKGVQAQITVDGTSISEIIVLKGKK